VHQLVNKQHFDNIKMHSTKVNIIVCIFDSKAMILKRKANKCLYHLMCLRRIYGQTGPLKTVSVDNKTCPSS